MPESWFASARREFHASLLTSTLTRNDGLIPSNADKGSLVSVAIANAILDQIGTCITGPKLPGQTAGANFEDICATYIRLAFGQLSHLRSGSFFVSKGGGIAQFDQYAHLSALQAIARTNREIATAIGSDYLIKPDVVIGRHPEDDADINRNLFLVDGSVANMTSLRKANNLRPILHASISCKWTLRSDRAQNARSEGLNLVRNRKGRLPHVAVITGEPMPTRLASLALGTGDIDCVYHFALTELRRAVAALDRDDTLELLDTMIEGNRLRDIADLPLDLVT